MEEMGIFKSYLRRLLQDLKDLQESIRNRDNEKAKKLTNQLIEDTQKGLEDN